MVLRVTEGCFEQILAKAALECTLSLTNIKMLLLKGAISQKLEACRPQWCILSPAINWRACKSCIILVVQEVLSTLWLY